MKELLIIGVVAFLGSGLTLFSGFGLGTLLMPVFAMFFPLEMAITMTAFVHLLNNLFKFNIFKKEVNYGILLRFGLPSLIASFVGASLLQYLSFNKSYIDFNIGAEVFKTTVLNLVMAGLLLFFVFWEWIPGLKKLQFSSAYLIPGGCLSGFFGGLSGHQGALRSAFLSRVLSDKNSFIATGISIACLVDISRIGVYLQNRNLITESSDNWLLVVSTTLFAFAGAWLGNRFLKKVTYESAQLITAIVLLVFAIFLALGKV